MGAQVSEGSFVFVFTVLYGWRDEQDSLLLELIYMYQNTVNIKALLYVVCVHIALF